MNAESTMFKDAIFRSCEIGTNAFLECNFSRASFFECNLECSMQRCCIDGTSFGNTDNGRPKLWDCSNDEESWEEDMYCQSTSM